MASFYCLFASRFSLRTSIRNWPHLAEAHIKDTRGVNSIYDFFSSLHLAAFYRRFYLAKWKCR